ncbi:hypothetical protein S40293_01911 [Stachybotrys chartarum IBT 40293]|nr:hypothetical protein S40293_01911 [Stachybotrys chartarum IBT 40293]
MNATDSSALFTCTFCYRFSPGPPQVLGRSARLACAPCYAALIDLSICWVCGEIVYRREECVSFGCRMLCTGASVRALYEDGDRGSLKRMRELAEAPLCAVCMVETELDRLGQDVVIQKGLRRVDKTDGGVTRKRWETNEAKKLDRARTQGAQKVVASLTMPKCIIDMSRQHRHASPVQTGLDGNESDHVGTNDSSISYSTIWVNIFDPINRPSYQARPLKPVPLFMQPFLSREELSRRTSPTWPRSNLRPVSSPSTPCGSRPGSPRLLSKATSSLSTSCPSVSGGSHAQAKTAIKPLAAYTSRVGIALPQQYVVGRYRQSPDLTSSETSLPYVSVDPLDLTRAKGGRSCIKEEPLKRPSSRFAHRPRRSKALSSEYNTPPEYMDANPSGPHPRSLSALRPASAEAAASFPGQCSQIPAALAAPTLSSEYLEKYRPLVLPRRRREASQIDELWKSGTAPAETKARRSRSSGVTVDDGGTTQDKANTGEWEGTPTGRIRSVGAELRKFFTGR